MFLIGDVTLSTNFHFFRFENVLTLLQYRDIKFHVMALSQNDIIYFCYNIAKNTQAKTKLTL